MMKKAPSILLLATLLCLPLPAYSQFTDATSPDELTLSDVLPKSQLDIIAELYSLTEDYDFNPEYSLGLFWASGDLGYGIYIHDPDDGSGLELKYEYAHNENDVEVIKITQKATIQSINLENRHLKGEIPSSISSLPNLVYLNLASNQLYGEVPDSLGNTNLETIDFHDNYLSGTLPDGIIQVLYNKPTINSIKDNLFNFSEGSANFKKYIKLSGQKIITAANIKQQRDPMDILTLTEPELGYETLSLSADEAISFRLQIENASEYPIYSDVSLAKGGLVKSYYEGFSGADGSVAMIPAESTLEIPIYAGGSSLVPQITNLGSYDAIAHYSVGQTLLSFEIVQHVSATVKDKDTGQPLAGATVHLRTSTLGGDEFTVQTDGEGFSTYLKITHDGTYWFEIETPGYDTLTTDPWLVDLNNTFHGIYELVPTEESSPLPPSLQNALNYVGSYYFSAWLGGFFVQGDDPQNTYYFTEDFGWVYVSPEGTTEGVWLYSFAMEDWLWASEATGRYFFSANRNSWLYVVSYEGGGSSINVLSTGQWFYQANF